MASEEQRYHINIIKLIRPDIKGKFDVRSVLDEIISINTSDRERILCELGNVGPTSASSTLLDTMLRCPPQTFIEFTKALVNTGRGDLESEIYQKVPDEYRHHFPNEERRQPPEGTEAQREGERLTEAVQPEHMPVEAVQPEHMPLEAVQPEEDAVPTHRIPSNN